jgi:hypothetical protein
VKLTIRKMLSKSLLAGAVFLVAAYAGPSVAGPYMYNTDAGWIMGSEVCAGCPGGIAFTTPADVPGGFQEMSWVDNLASGDPRRSHLTVESFNSGGVIEADGSLIPLFRFTHENNVISVAYNWQVQLGIATDAQAVGGPLTPGIPAGTMVPVIFTETFNQAPCASNNTGSFPCEDNFVAMNIGGLFGAFIFSNATDIYTLTVNPADITVVNAAVDPTGLPNSVTVYTAEGQTSVITIYGRVVQRPVGMPEPGMLLLVGLGLTLLGWVTRHGRKAP